MIEIRKDHGTFSSMVFSYQFALKSLHISFLLINYFLFVLVSGKANTKII